MIVQSFIRNKKPISSTVMSSLCVEYLNHECWKIPKRSSVDEGQTIQWINHD